MSEKDNYLPDVYVRFWQQFPDSVHDAFYKLAQNEHAAGPLDDRSRRLVKLGIAIGASSQGGVRSQARQALKAGLDVEDLHHAVLLALSTIGLPQTVAAFKWIEDVVDSH